MPDVLEAAPFTWRTESDTPPPEKLIPVDDALKADDALRLVRKGSFLLQILVRENSRNCLHPFIRGIRLKQMQTRFCSQSFERCR